MQNKMGKGGFFYMGKSSNYCPKHFRFELLYKLKAMTCQILHDHVLRRFVQAVVVGCEGREG